MTAGDECRRVRGGRLVAIMALQASFLAWWFLVPLPSVGGVTLRRFDLAMRALPAVVPGVRWGDSHIGRAVAQLGHPEHLPQRWPIVLASLLVAGAALGIGSMILRGLGVRAMATPAERVALAFTLGTTGLGVATLVLGRTIGLDPVAVRLALGGAVLAGLGVAAWDHRRAAPGARPAVRRPGWSPGQALGFAAIAGPFVALMGLGAMLPTIEFDALEYHLQGPKEYFLDGRVGFLPHNVYTSMPAGVEMLTTLAMEVLGDWWTGALAGQELIAWFAPATTILIAAATTRLAGSSRAGWVAGLVYLTTPWIFRVAGTPFVEGPLCCAHAALIWAATRFGRPDAFERGPKTGPIGAGMLVGLVAGGALAIKYPALISAVIPAALVVALQAWRARCPRSAIGFVVGLGVVVAPWLGKNLVDAGNPVYPLAWSVFGGGEWDAARDARWRVAHGPRPIAAGLLVGSILDAAGRSDWQSPLYALLAPLAWTAARFRRAAGALTIYAAYLFLTWWLLTHRLDRFWLPMLPALAVLAGLGAEAWLAGGSRVVGGWLALVLAAAIGANLTLCSTELAGPTAWTADLAAVRDESARDGTPGLARLDATLPPGARPLVIGQAGTFGLRHRPLYNTVFDRDLFEAIARGRTPAAVHRALADRRITHVYVDWAEIDRYRQPGNYGFTDFETPEVFDRLVAAGVLGPAARFNGRQDLHEVRPLAP